MENQLAVFIDFENIALWAEHEFFDFQLTPLMEFLQARGPAVVKRAYGDWSRFSRYRDELMNLSIDLIQIYSSRAGKNRADIRMAIDSFEIAMTRSQIKTFVIVSGDSDFSPLAAKLREYGRYTLGIGPRSVTHDLLVKSCDEFVYLETALGETDDVVHPINADRENARRTLRRALRAHGQRGEVPLLAARLKQTMLLMDPAFNEANFGYSQFKNWLEDNQDLVRLFVKELQMYVAPADYIVPANLGLSPLDLSQQVDAGNGSGEMIEEQYRDLFSRLKMTSTDPGTRRDVLRDIYRELNEEPEEISADGLIDRLHKRYASMDMLRSKSQLHDVLEFGIRQEAVLSGDDESNSPIQLAEQIKSEADFVRWAEADFIYAVVRSGLDLDKEELACIILNDRAQEDYVDELVEDLKQRGKISQKGHRYTLAGEKTIPFRDDPNLKLVCQDIEDAILPEGIAVGVSAARELAKKAMIQRSQDFVASANSFLLACRLQWDAIERNETGATLQDLRWYMASYASAIAGKLSQVQKNYAAARPYYLVFFALVQEDDPLWSRMRGLINPMLAYFWLNVAREQGYNTNEWNLSAALPPQIAVKIANHPALGQTWYDATASLAAVNPSLLRRIGNQITLQWSESPEHQRVADQIRKMLGD